VELLPTGGDPAAAEASIVMLDGSRAGETLDAFLQGPSGQLEVPDYRVGDEVVVSQSLEPDSVYVAVADRWRIPALALMSRSSPRSRGRRRSSSSRRCWEATSTSRGSSSRA